MKSKKKLLSAAESESTLQTLAARFEANMSRHPKVSWKQVRERLSQQPDKLWSLAQMEATGGEPDIVAPEDDRLLRFFDCAPETPSGRRSLCYDHDAWKSRKANKPKGNIIDLAREMGVTLLDEAAYRFLQQNGSFDKKTSSWIQTPSAVRKLGGALFGDRRYDQVFIYHNGAESYYSARGFRAFLEI